MTYCYPTIDETPALVKWGVDIIGNEYAKLESEQYKKQTHSIKTPQGSVSKQKK